MLITSVREIIVAACANKWHPTVDSYVKINANLNILKTLQQIGPINHDFAIVVQPPSTTLTSLAIAEYISNDMDDPQFLEVETVNFRHIEINLEKTNVFNCFNNIMVSNILSHKWQIDTLKTQAAMYLGKEK